MSVPTRLARTLLGGHPDDEIRHLADLTGVEVLDELGRGSQTVVYRVRRDGVEYAMKVLRRAVDHGDSLSAFRREAALLACVDHPGLARVREVGVAEDRPYLVMDLIQGRRLTETLAGEPMAADRVVSIGTEVGGALAAAHGAGLVHRDVKPDNILLPADGRARLIDFGLATRAVDAHLDAVAGTLVYTAPEQAGLLKRPVDGRADLYSLGAVLFECATGQPPFSSLDVGDLLRMHATRPVPDVRAFRPDLSPALAAIIATLLAKDPDDRYQSGAGLLADLGRVAEEREFALRTADEPVGRRRDIRLVGRDVELGVLTERWNRARLGQGGVALIQGPPGSGKSRLVRELLADARRAGQLVLQGRCVADESVPLAPLRSAVEEYVRSLHRLPDAERVAAGQRLTGAAGSVAPLLSHLSPALGELLRVPDLPSGDSHEQFAVAVATFLVELARQAGGAVVHLDDVQWIDEDTCRVLAELAGELDGAPLLLVLAAADGGAHSAERGGPHSAEHGGAHSADRGAERGPIVASLWSGLGGAVDTRVTLEPLTVPGVAGLITALTCGLTISAEDADVLAARTDGNPFALLEYASAVVDAGLVRPDWGAWRLDEDALVVVDLPGTTAELVVRRLDMLDAQSRHVLGVAAATGTRFSTDLVADVCHLDRRSVLDIADRAAWHHLVERREGDRYGFVHSRIREALLSQFEGAQLSRLHGRIADVLAARASGDPEAVYALARHCQLASADASASADTIADTDRDTDRDADRDADRDTGGDQARLFRTGYAAGLLALADHAPAQALLFLEPAAAVTVPRADTCEFDQTLGIAYHRVGRFRDAVEVLGRALAACADPFVRATILHLIARVHDSTWNTAEQVTAIEQGLAELGRPLSTRPVLVVLSTVWQVVLGYLVGLTRIGYGSVRGARREQFVLLASLYDAGSVAYARELRPGTAAVFVLRQTYLVNRLGPGPEQARATVALAYLNRRAGLRRIADRGFARGARIAAKLTDPRLGAYIAWLRGAAMYGSGADDGATMRRAFAEYGRWLDPGQSIDVMSLLWWDALLAGDMAEADIVFERRRIRVAASGQLSRNAMYAAEAAHLARRGRAGEAAGHLDRMRERSPQQPIWERVDTLIATLLLAVEQSDVGTTFDQAVTQFYGLGVGPLSLIPSQDCVYVYIAYGRLEQYRLASGADRPARLVAARRAVTAVRAVAARPLVRAHHRVLAAAMLQLAGRDEAALAKLGKDEPVRNRVDAPLVAFEAARVRTRALRALGVRGEADRQARSALAVAVEEDWPQQVRRVIAEFGVKSAADGHTQTYSRMSDGVVGDIHRQRLDALEQVSLAAAQVLDPVALARIALDETIRILAADRAFLFLLEGDPAKLVANIGRDAAGNDLLEPTAYSTTLVERVRHSKEALVVTGTEEGAALGSQSVVLHGLRSIMVVPLQLDGRLLGVVYLDSRLAKGIFTVDDVGILAAITNHVAVALETARASQLEVAVATARRERDLADTLRGAMTEISGTLEPAEVLQRLVATVSRVLACDRVLLVLSEPLPEPLTGEPLAGEPAAVGFVPAGAGPVYLPPDDDGLRRLVDATAPFVGAGIADRPAILVTALRDTASWMGVPLCAGEDHLGVLLLASRLPAAYDQTQAGLAAALVGHGMIAYEKATLFAQVELLATIDGLTGVANRRHFFALAARELAKAGRQRRQLVAMMIDIDHFKRVNDTHGHQVGDEVIRAVAGRLQQLGRSCDLVGRYGGEEFAVLLAAGEDNAAVVAERLRAAVGDSPIATRIGPLAVTISVGVTNVESTDRDVDSVLGRADQCLFRAKQAGRNRVFVAAAQTA